MVQGTRTWGQVAEVQAIDDVSQVVGLLKVLLEEARQPTPSVVVVIAVAAVFLLV